MAHLSAGYQKSKCLPLKRMFLQALECYEPESQMLSKIKKRNREYGRKTVLVVDGDVRMLSVIKLYPVEPFALLEKVTEVILGLQ